MYIYIYIENGYEQLLYNTNLYTLKKIILGNVFKTKEKVNNK